MTPPIQTSWFLSTLTAALLACNLAVPSAQDVAPRGATCYAPVAGIESFDDVKVFAVEFDDPNRPSAVGSHAITGSAARTTLVIFNQGQEVAVYGGQDPAAISSLLM